MEDRNPVMMTWEMSGIILTDAALNIMLNSRRCIPSIRATGVLRWAEETLCWVINSNPDVVMVAIITIRCYE